MSDYNKADNGTDYTEGCRGAKCGNSTCPCSICHGDPGKYLPGSHGGIDMPNGKKKCRNCYRIS